MAEFNDNKWKELKKKWRQKNPGAEKPQTKKELVDSKWAETRKKIFDITFFILRTKKKNSSGKIVSVEIKIRKHKKEGSIGKFMSSKA